MGMLYVSHYTVYVTYATMELNERVNELGVQYIIERPKYMLFETEEHPPLFT